MQESGKAYLNGKPVDFSEFRGAPDLIREFITTPTNKAPEPTTCEAPGTSETTPEDEDTEEDLAAEEKDGRDALIAACVKKALEDAEQGNTPRVPEPTGTEDKQPHPYAVPERLIKGPINPLVMLADVGRLPKDYRSRLMRRALAESSEPTLTPNELMERIHASESRVGATQKRLHIQVPGEAEGHPVVFFTTHRDKVSRITHPDKVVRINGVPVTARVYQRIIHWCTEIVKPIPGGDWEGDGYLDVEPVVYFDGVKVSLSEVPDLIRAHGAEDLLQPLPPIVISNTADVFEFGFGQEAQDTSRVKAFIGQGVYLENSEGGEPRMTFTAVNIFD